jgi:hypothetical protein
MDGTDVDGNISGVGAASISSVGGISAVGASVRDAAISAAARGDPDGGLRIHAVAGGWAGRAGWAGGGGGAGGGGKGRKGCAHAVNHQAIRVVERIDAVAADAACVEDDARGVVRAPAETDLADDVGIAVEAQRLIGQRRGGLCVGKIDEDARLVADALVVERHFRVEIDDDAHGVRQDGPANGVHRGVSRGGASLLGAMHRLGIDRARRCQCDGRRQDPFHRSCASTSSK